MKKHVILLLVTLLLAYSAFTQIELAFPTDGGTEIEVGAAVKMVSEGVVEPCSDNDGSVIGLVEDKNEYEGTRYYNITNSGMALAPLPSDVSAGDKLSTGASGAIRKAVAGEVVIGVAMENGDADPDLEQLVIVIVAASGGGSATNSDTLGHTLFYEGTGEGLRTTGGNARGSHAVDLQTSRTAVGQVASGNYSVIGGGWRNTASGLYTTIGGGIDNTASSMYDIVGGGLQNTANGTYATVGGGWFNEANNAATVSGGQWNTASGRCSTVGGGWQNKASGDYSAVGGGWYNTVSGLYSAIPGGFADTVSGDYSFAFGNHVVVATDYTARFFSAAHPGSLIVDGDLRVTGEIDPIAVTYQPQASAPTGVEGKLYYDNTANELKLYDGSSWQSVGGGGSSTWADNTTFIMVDGQKGVFGYGNYAYGIHDSTHVNLGVACTTGKSGFNYKYCTVGGGFKNTASGDYGATVGGGYQNTASDLAATVGGGYDNDASYDYATVGGGRANTASEYTSTVGGGYGNTASGLAATVGGGYGNTASYDYATVGGGYQNTASGSYSTIPGGYMNNVSGDNSFAFGNTVNVSSNYTAQFFSTANPGQLHVGGDIWAEAGGFRGYDTSGSDSFSISDDGDTTRIKSDNPIKIGNSSLIVETDGDVYIDNGALTVNAALVNENMSIGYNSTSYPLFVKESTPADGTSLVRFVQDGYGYALYASRNYNFADRPLISFKQQNDDDDEAVLELGQSGSGVHITTEVSGEDLLIDPNGFGSTKIYGDAHVTGNLSIDGTFPLDNDWTVSSTNTYSNNSGNVGIGVTSPETKLHVKSSSLPFAHYIDYTTATIEGSDGRLQLLANNAGTGGSSIIMTNTYAADSNTHWEINHFTNGDLVIGYEATTESGSSILPLGSDVSITLKPNGEVNIKGDLNLEGALRGNQGAINGAPFPRPAYDSGWESVAVEHNDTLYHNLGGNVDDYIVRLDGKETDSGYGVHNLCYGYGFMRDSGPWIGMAWFGLTTTRIIVGRQIEDNYYDQYRIRIWIVE